QAGLLQPVWRQHGHLAVGVGLRVHEPALPVDLPEQEGGVAAARLALAVVVLRLDDDVRHRPHLDRLGLLARGHLHPPPEEGRLPPPPAVPGAGCRARAPGCSRWGGGGTSPAAAASARTRPCRCSARSGRCCRRPPAGPAPRRAPPAPRRRRPPTAACPARPV